MNPDNSILSNNRERGVSQIRLESGGQKWEVLPEIKALFDELLSSTGEKVKRSALRSVTRHRIRERVFYIKNYFHDAEPLAPAKYFFKNAPSRDEWKLAPRLLELGISIVPHLAHGERWSWRGLVKSTLITEGPAGFAPLNPACSSASVQAALGKFIRRLHECSVFHNDLHISNLLYAPENNEFCLVDLDNMKIFPSLQLEQRLDNLATLHRRFPLTQDFYAAYGAEFSDCAAKVADLAERKNRSGIPKKLKLLFQDRTAFARKKCGDLQWHVRMNRWNEKLQSILEQPDQFLATRAQLLKDGTRSTVGCADDLVLKRFNFKKVSTVLFDCVRASRARHSFRTARHLELLNIATPRPIAYADHRRLGFIARSYFVMEKIPGATYLWKHSGERRADILKLAGLIARMHDEGFSHRDLKETNIVLDASGIPHLIDLDAMRYVRHISNARAAVELARLVQGFSRRGQISNQERLRFLKHYCACRQIQDWRWWWNRVGENSRPLHRSK